MLTEKKKRDGASFSLHDKRELERLVRMRTSRTYRQREKQQKERLAEQRGREGDRESKLAELLERGLQRESHCFQRLLNFSIRLD